MNTNRRKVKFSPLKALLPYQLKWVKDKSRFKIGVWSRQTGKSLCTACEAVSDCLSDPGTQWVCLSAGERQALEWLKKAKDWTIAYQESWAGEEHLRDGSEALLKSAEIRFKNGSSIMAIPANPSTARGYSANIVLDEFAYHEKPDTVWSAMYPSQTNPLAGTFLERVRAMRDGRDFNNIERRMKIRVVSTFNGQGNKFFSLWERRSKDSPMSNGGSTTGIQGPMSESETGETPVLRADGNGFVGHFITIHDAVREGLKVSIDELRAGLDDPDAWAQEFECVPADVSAVLLPYDLIATCESPEASATVNPDFFAATRNPRPYVMGIDYGRKRDLSVAWTDEIMGDVAHCREVLEMKEMSTPEQIELLRPRIRGAHRVCLDYSSPGLGLGDFLVKEFGEYNPQKHLFGKIELCTFTNPLKVELFSKLRMAFEQRQCRIPINRAIREDLHSVQRVTTTSGNITYRAPHREDGHADRCTAKALAHRAMGCSRQPVAFSRVKTGPSADDYARFFGVSRNPWGGGDRPHYGCMPSDQAEREWARREARRKGREFF